MHRFYVADSLDERTINLQGEEAAHMLRVLRLNTGERVTLFDGKGCAAVAEICEVQKQSAQLTIQEQLAVAPDDGLEITVVTAVPKSDRFRWLVEKATELGVKRLIPVRTARSIVHPGQGKIQKMQAAVIAACKQCGRNDLMTIEPLQDWSDVLARLASTPWLVADPEGRPLAQVMAQAPAEEALNLAVGPEGGFTPAEIEGPRKGRLQDCPVGVVSSPN